MHIKKISAIYTILIGISIIMLWTMLITTNQVIEIETETMRITYHIVAEILTAAMLIIAGVGLLTKQKWGFELYLISLGMLFYTVIASAGYYVEKDDISMTIMFTILQILTIFFIVLSLYKRKEYKIK